MTGTRTFTRILRGAAAAAVAVGLALAGLKPISAALAAPAGAPAQSTACVATYLVKPGDTLSAIAVAYNVQWIDLATANALRHPELIYAGQALCIPGGTITSSAATRIRFGAGATTATVARTVQAGQPRAYVLRARRAQTMMVSLTSPNNDVTLMVAAPAGTLLTGAAASNWQGTLPVSGDYALNVLGGTPGEAFTLTVSVAARIQFAPGAVQAVLSGKTTGGFTVLYSAWARQGQTMSLALGGVGANAALTVWGFEDGQPYLRYVIEQTSFSLRLPATQDYIIGVMPRAGAAVPYTLTVKIQ